MNMPPIYVPCCNFYCKDGTLVFTDGEKCPDCINGFVLTDKGKIVAQLMLEYLKASNQL